MDIQRDEKGRFLPGNKSALTHGAYARRLPLKIRREGAKIYQGIVADLGGAGQITTAQHVLIEKSVGLYQITRTLEEYLVKWGIMKKQRLNPALAVYGSMVNSLRLNLSALGIDRRGQERIKTVAQIVDEIEGKDDEHSKSDKL